MKLEGQMRLEAHMPNELWDRMEKDRGELTRSEWTRNVITAYLDSKAARGAFIRARDLEIEGALAHSPVKSARELLAERSARLRGQ